MHRYELPLTGYVRLKHLIAPLGPIPLSRSTVYALVKAGRLKPPVRLAARASAWRWEDVRAYLDQHDERGASDGKRR